MEPDSDNALFIAIGPDHVFDVQSIMGCFLEEDQKRIRVVLTGGNLELVPFVHKSKAAEEFSRIKKQLLARRY